MKIIWSDEALEQLQFWKRTNPKISKRIRLLIDNISLTPYTGIGKPEPLKYDRSFALSKEYVNLEKNSLRWK